MRTVLLLLCVLFYFPNSYSQNQQKQLPAKRTNSAIKIDGVLDDAAWKEMIPVTNLIEQRPNAGRIEDYATRSEMYLLYDNTSIYVAGYLYERTVDSISKELVGRDRIGTNDFAGITLDTYFDKINAVGFYITPLGEQFDIRYSPTNEELSWSAVWHSAAKINSDGWSFEMRIPYSALRFVSKDNQTWGLNIIRQRRKTGQQFTWNFVDPKVSGFINQEGAWTGIEKINAPIRLSFSPYLSANINHYKPDTKNWRAAVNGGMDVKYGISESFTLDMTLVPDFGQVQSDNKILNLSPFEVQYQENRAFFTEGTELFNKGNLFYSRRIGSRPIYYGNTQKFNLAPGETVISDPIESKLINATKISGRTKNGMGLGFFNAITKPMHAEIENSAKQIRKVETNPLTNYNIMVFDQSLKNNSSVSFINTNVLRSGSDYDANVSAALFNVNNKKNTYRVKGKLAVSQINNSLKNTVGYSHNLGFGKTGGRWNFEINQSLEDDKYDINDLGILYANNDFNHFLYTGYRWIKPKNWYNRIQINLNAGYNTLYKRFPNQKVNTKFIHFNTNINANAQLKNLWFVGMFMGYAPQGNDFFEPRQPGYSYKTPQRIQFNGWFETNQSKKYAIEFNYFIGIRSLFNSTNQDLNFEHRYRFSDKFSLSQELYLNVAPNDAGYYTKFFEQQGTSRILKDIIFSRRDRKTVENQLEAKYNFNNTSGITVRARHYWSKVRQRQLYDLKNDGTLSPTVHTLQLKDDNFNIFNVDAVYTWQFAPGSFINIVWKDEGFLSDNDSQSGYFKNFNRTITEPHNNNLSVKIIYYLDYLDFKKWRKKTS